MGYVLVKPGVKFDTIAPAGFMLLRAFSNVASIYGDLTITSGTDGAHSGVDDPHHKGCAYDVRSSCFDWNTKQIILNAVMANLRGEVSDNVREDSGGLITDYFFGWLEDSSTDNEHFHFQLRHNKTLPRIGNDSST